MKTIYKFLLLLLPVFAFEACQPEHFREVYPVGDPQLTANLLTKEVQYAKDSISFEVTVTETETPLSTLSIKVVVGMNVIVNEQVRTKDYEFSSTFTYPVPLLANMEEGEKVKVYLTATNVEGTAKDLILDDCIGHRPAIKTMYVIPQAVGDNQQEKSIQMTFDGEWFNAYEMAYPKTVECLLAVAETEAGQVDWNYPVFGLMNGKVAAITEEQFKSKNAVAFSLADNAYQAIDTIRFNPFTFEIYFAGKPPVFDVMVDLDEIAGKNYRYAQIYFDPEIDMQLSGVTNVETAYNLDFMEYKGDNRVKFLAEKGMYSVYYLTDLDYLVVEPLADAIYPDAMWMTGVGFGYPTAVPEATGGWGFDNPGQYIACRTVAPKVYQFTAYFENEQSTAYADYGTLNFKFFHKKGWGGEENGGSYKQEGLNIYGVDKDGDGLTKIDGTTGNEKGNWIATNVAFEGVYRVTLDQNTMTTKYEKIR